MSSQAPPLILTPPTTDPKPAEQPHARSFVSHARLISFLTLISRFFGLAREMAQANYFGTGLVAGAFRVAFTIPNLFRKLFGEGALSAAFIPLYVQSVKNESPEQASRFAAASVTLLSLMLLALTVLGELIIAALIYFSHDLRPDLLLTLKLTAIMLPYVLLICGTAFLAAILQVHKRFGPPAATPIILNAVHIAVMVLGGYLLHLKSAAHDPALLIQKQTTLAYYLAFFVLIAGVLQVLSLKPALTSAGFHLRFIRSFWTPGVKRMLVLSVPVALGAGVLQLSVLMDKGISALLAQNPDRAGHLLTHFSLLGHTLRYPMEFGAISRLDLAQFLYQFPLGVFAIALATAIFPSLSADALDHDRDRFRAALRQGIELSLWEGFAASAGLILVRYPAIRLIFRHGFLTDHDVPLIARSLVFYASAIWAFSLLQIINRAYYSLHDTKTPFVMSVVNIVINLVVEIPLLWTNLGESAMAVGTCVSFAIQAVLMLYMLDRRIGSLGLQSIALKATKMIFATAIMILACTALTHLPIYPADKGKLASAIQLFLLIATGGATYFAACAAMGMNVLDHLRFRPARA